MTSALRWRWMVSTTPRPLYPRERRGTHCIGAWVGPRAGLYGCGKSRPPPGFDPQTVQPVASRYIDWAIRAHTKTYREVETTAPYILNRGLRWNWVVRPSAVRFYRGERASGILEVGFWVCLTGRLKALRFLDWFAWLRKTSVGVARVLSRRTFVRVENSAPTGRIFMKFYIWFLFKNMSRKFKFH